MKPRIITGIIFGVIVLASIYGGEVSCIMLFGLISLFASFELARMLRRNVQAPAMMFTMIAGFLPYVLSMYFPMKQMGLMISIVLSCILMLLFTTLMIRNRGANFLEKFSPLTAFFYIGVPLYLLRVVLLKPPFQWELVLCVILLIWSSDTFAYIVGSAIGKNKLYYKISPGKTWEGFLGAGIMTILVAVGLKYVFGEFPLLFYVFLGFIVWLLGGIGDLFESYLKRHFKVKDSGSFLPGHGGFLDRFDSFIFVIPFVCLLMVIFEVF
ncbi:phosphatidate cytidylyltransferase [Portibacter marinus]|uniref:phosphatidate cytidylyltransferase n=1 Tax=Portibacter marinus TaxID=2898660 RepID=UPI001F483DC8|nr:phosphatidate cytidylyltransferase [Portibacter marinus]